MSDTILNQYTPDFVSPPGETLLELLEEREMSQAELAERTGRPKKTINEIIKGKAAITPETAIQFERVLGTPAHFWNIRESNYRGWLAIQQEQKILAEYIPWMKKFPLREMIKMGWMEEHKNPVNQVQGLLSYLGIATPVQWQDMLADTQWRQSPTFAADPAAVSIWLRQGELQAKQIVCAKYDEKEFQNVLLQIRGLTRYSPDRFTSEMNRLCAQAGVAVVLVPEIAGTRTCGATRWLTSTKALIMLSLRYKTDDHLWFTFFHEAAHILMHSKKEVFLEDAQEGYEGVNDKEAEADQFAAEILIPTKDLQKFHPSGLHFSHDDIMQFAEAQGIAPGIVVGRLQHDGIVPLQNFNKLKRRFIWSIKADSRSN